jgi:hypothetical protein
MVRERVSGRNLNERYGVGAAHALYRKDGRWYHRLRAFPGALFDASGYILFETEEEYLECSQLQIGHDLHVPLGISSIPGYVTFADTRREVTPRRDRLHAAPPPPVSPARPRRPRAGRPRAARVTDYETLDRENRTLGKAGEKLVFAYEKTLLADAGRHDLLWEVRHVAEEDGDGAGYDIKSVTPEGEVKYIEVKTTRGPASTSFIVTRNEVEFSEEYRDNYYLYRVYNYDEGANTGSLYILRGSVKDSFGLEPMRFRATR